MTQREFERALARATGESVRAIRRLGFSLVDSSIPASACEVPEIGPQMVDWDELEADRITLAIQA